MRRKRHWAVSFVFVVAVALAIVTLGGLIARWISGEAPRTVDKVAVVRIEGMIIDPKTVLEALERQDRDPKVRAIVLRIDSPGGAVAPTQEIYRSVRELNDRKKVVASLGSMATSGGYYIACGAEKIVANPGTLTGSIGVVIHLANLEGLLTKLGIQAEVVKSGEHKDMGSVYRPLTEPQRRILQEVIDDVHQQFMEDVARARNLELERVKAIADGRVFSGRQAKALGLVDELGGLREAVQLAARLAQIKEEPLVVEEPKEKFSFLRWLLGDSSMNFLSWERSLGQAGILLFHP